MSEGEGVSGVQPAEHCLGELRRAQNDAWLHNRCAAINLRTLLRHGLTRSGGAWVLA